MDAGALLVAVIPSVGELSALELVTTLFLSTFLCLPAQPEQPVGGPAWKYQLVMVISLLKQYLLDFFASTISLLQAVPGKHTF